MSVIEFKSVRLAYPHIFTKAQYRGDITKYSAKLLFNKNDKVQIEAFQSEINDRVKDNKIKVENGPKGNICMFDGDLYGSDNYANCFVVSASNKIRPSARDVDMGTLVESDDKFYNGCYVNALVELWIQDNKYGKAVRATLHGVQFVKDGVPFGPGNVNVDQYFKPIVAEDGDDMFE
jgi:hypothetical protein